MRIDRVKFIALLRERDMTQKELAELSGVSRATINGIASGRRTSDLSASKIANALNIDVNDLKERHLDEKS